jgi:hypothetical protein
MVLAETGTSVPSRGRERCSAPEAAAYVPLVTKEAPHKDLLDINAAILEVIGMSDDV